MPDAIGPVAHRHLTNASYWSWCNALPNNAAHHRAFPALHLQTAVRFSRRCWKC